MAASHLSTQLRRELGDFVSVRRRDLGLSQLDLADRMKGSTRTVQRIEEGVANPQLETLCRLAKALRVDLTMRFTPEVGIATRIEFRPLSDSQPGS